MGEPLVRAEAWPHARHHPSWPAALALIEASGLPGSIVVGRHVRRPVFTAVISKCIPMTVQQGEGATPLEAVEMALGKVAA